MLQYRESVIIKPEIREDRMVELHAPTDWGLMKRSNGNESMHKKAERLLSQLDQDAEKMKNVLYLKSFLHSCRIAIKSWSMVRRDEVNFRDRIADFFIRACECVGVDREEALDIWTEVM